MGELAVPALGLTATGDRGPSDIARQKNARGFTPQGILVAISPFHDPYPTGMSTVHMAI
jgi:hypothetical protein